MADVDLDYEDEQNFGPQPELKPPHDSIDGVNLAGEGKPDIIDQDDPAILDDDTERLEKSEEEEGKEWAEDTAKAMAEAQKTIQDAGGVMFAVLSGIPIQTFVQAGYSKKEITKYRADLLDYQKQTQALHALAQFRTPQGIDVQGAIRAGLDDEVKTVTDELTYNLNKAQIDAQDTLAALPGVVLPDGGYDLANAVTSTRPEVKEAIQVLFGAEKLREAEAQALERQGYYDIQNMNAEYLAPYIDVQGNVDTIALAKDRLFQGASISQIRQQFADLGFTDEAAEQTLDAIPINDSLYEDYIKDKGTRAQVIKRIPYDTPEDIKKEINDWYINDVDVLGTDRTITPEKFALLSNDAQKAILRAYLTTKQARETRPLEYFVPIAGTIRTAKEQGLTSGWTITSAIADALLVAGVVNAAAVGARSFGLPGKAGRVRAAAKGVRTYTIGTGEGITAKEFGETLTKDIQRSVVGATDYARGGYIPLSGLETSEGTIRIPIRVAGSAEDAIKIRDMLMQKLLAGETPVVEYQGTTYKINQAFIKGPAHAAPSSTVFEEGAKVGVKIRNAKGDIQIIQPGQAIPKGYTPMSETEQGLFIGSGVHSRFVPSSAFGAKGESPAVGIFSEGVSEQAIPTGKVYRGAVEAEVKLPVGAEVPETSPYGYSRTAGGTKFGVRSTTNISRLRKIGARLLEPYHKVKSIYTPAIEITGEGAGRIGKIDLLDEAIRYDKAAQEALRNGHTSLARSLFKEAMALREERMARPLTAAAARNLASQFARYAIALANEARALERSGVDATTLRDANTIIKQAENYLRELAADRKLRTLYNNYVSLPEVDKLAIHRSTDEERREANIPPEITRIITTVDRSDTGERRILESETSVVRRLPEEVTRENIPYRPIREDVDRTYTRIPERRIPDRIPRERYRTPPLEETPPKAIVLPPLSTEAKRKYGIDDRGTIAHYQGQLNGQEIWHVIKWPYKTKDDVTRYIGVTPPGIEPIRPGENASYRSIQLITGKPPANLTMDLGIQDITIQFPKGSKGTGTIRYKRDRKQKTTSRINIKGTKIIRSRPELRRVG